MKNTLPQSTKYTVHTSKKCYETFKTLLTRERKSTISFDFLHSTQNNSISASERESLICDLLQVFFYE